MADAALRSANPDKPWLWRQEWVEGVLRDQYRRETAALLMFGIVLTAIGFGALYFVPAPRFPLLVILLLFLASGLLFLSSAVRNSVRRAKFGSSTCRLERVPVAPGTAMCGEIHTRLGELPRDGFFFELTCVRSIGSFSQRQTTQDFLWEAEHRISADGIAPNPEGVRVPFSLEIPPDVPSTDESDPNKRVYWLMRVSAHVEGVDFAAQFTVPIFHTAGGPTNAQIIEYREAQRAAAAQRTPSAASRVTFSPFPNGIRIVIKGNYRIGNFVKGALVLALWAGAVYLLVALDVPLLFPIILGTLGLLPLYGWPDAFFGYSVIDADKSGVTMERHSAFGLKFTDEIDTHLIVSVVHAQNGTLGQVDFYDVQVTLSVGAKRSAGSYLASRDDAAIVAARIEAAASPTP